MSPDVVVRPASPDDVDRLLELLELVAAEARWIGTEVPIDRERRRAGFLDAIDSDSDAVLVADTSDGLVGEIFLHNHRGLVEIGMLVEEAWRGRGVGSALMTAALDWAHAANAHKMSLQVWPHNESAIKLYERFGFEQEGYLPKQWKRKSGEIWDSIVMGQILIDD